MNKRILAALVLVAAAVGAGLLFSSKDGADPPTPTLAEQAALDWVLEGSRETTATGDEYAGPFPDQGMPGDPIPSFVVFDRDSEDLFYVVFKQSQDIYTASYALRKRIDDPRMRDLRFGYGWFDLSRPLEPPLQVWKLDGGRWVWQPYGRGVAPIIGASFSIDGYDILPSEGGGNRQMYVDGSGSNTGDAPARAECYLVYGSQTELIEGPYLDATIAPGRTLSVSGDVTFPEPLDDNESSDVDCRVQGSS
jgi:hypothetical protein